jgi:hypothetical protein
MVEVGRSNTSKLLDLAGADSSTFCNAFDDMMDYVGDLGNLHSIAEELKGLLSTCFVLLLILFALCIGSSDP